jgi:hypothetical protein
LVNCIVTLLLAGCSNKEAQSEAIQPTETSRPAQTEEPFDYSSHWRNQPYDRIPSIIERNMDQFGNMEYDEAVAAMDQFYSDPKNKLISFSSAAYYIGLANRSDATSAATVLEGLRRNAR